jgi:hypothetical protein
MPSTEEELDRKTFLYNLLVPVMNKYVCVSAHLSMSRRS